VRSVHVLVLSVTHDTTTDTSVSLSRSNTLRTVDCVTGAWDESNAATTPTNIASSLYISPERGATTTTSTAATTADDTLTVTVVCFTPSVAVNDDVASEKSVLDAVAD
jgi:hypothetical protein